MSDWAAKAKELVDAWVTQLDTQAGSWLTFDDLAQLKAAAETALREAARVPEAKDAEIERLRWEIKCGRRWKNWRSMMGGPDQSEVREAWEAAIRENDAKDQAASAPTKNNAARGEGKKCAECGIYPPDHPSKTCCGCDAYREHQQ